MDNKIKFLENRLICYFGYYNREIMYWFRIKYLAKPKSAYYLHLGRASDGCITVYAPDVNPADTWTKIYNQIVTCRVEGMPGIIGKVRVRNEIK